MQFFVPVKGAPAPDFTASTLVLPQPSLASLAQLACDLIVHNHRLDLVGYLGLQDHVPAVGARDSLPGRPPPPGVSLACEVFATPNCSLVIALPRSPVIRARRVHYLDALRQWIRQAGFREVLVVAGADAAMRADDGLNAPTPLRHLIFPSPPPLPCPSSSPSPSSSASASASAPAATAPPAKVSSPSPSPSRLSTILRQISTPYLSATPSGGDLPSSSELDPDPAAAANDDDGNNNAERRIPPIPHGGLTRRLLTTLATSSDPPGVAIHALIMYTSEGGGASESAHFLASALATLLLLPPTPAELELGSERERERGSDPNPNPNPSPTVFAIPDPDPDLDLEGQGDSVLSRRCRWKEPQSWERGLLGPELANEAGREMYG